MKSRVQSLSSIFIVACWFSSIARGDLPQSRLSAISPVGGQAGSALELSLTAGEDLEEVTRLRFSHPGITAVSIPTGEQEAAGNTTPRFIVTIAPDVPPGLYDVVCEGRWGVSNPRRFLVGPRPVSLEPEGSITLRNAHSIQIGGMVNGSLKAPQEVDWYRVSLEAGQPVVFDCWAARIDSRARPILTVTTSDGRRILASSRTAQRGDPVLPFVAPASGDYLVKLHDVTYRSGTDFTYLLDIHVDPLLLDAEPAIIDRNRQSPITLYGVHLPGGKKSGRTHHGVELDALEVEVSPPDQWETRLGEQLVSPAAAALDGFDYRLVHGESSSFPIRIGLSSMPVRLQAQLSTGSAQELIELPVTIQGRFTEPTRQHRFKFHGEKGQSLTFAVIADRLGSLLDPMLILERVQLGKDGQEEFVSVGTADDSEPNLLPQGFESQSNDPTLTVVLPETATYRLTLQNRFGGAAEAHRQTYQLSIGPSVPDFKVVAIAGSPGAMPATASGMRKGDRVQFTFYVFPQQGFSGAIRIRAVELPAGTTCETAIIPSQSRVGSAMLTSNVDVESGWHDLQFIAEEVPVEAGSGSRVIQRTVRPMAVIRAKHQDQPTMSRLTSLPGIGVLPEIAPVRLDLPVTHFEIASGGQISIPIQIVRTAASKDPIQLTIPALAKHLTIVPETATVPAGATAHELVLAAKEELPTGQTSFWIKGETKVDYHRNPESLDRLKLNLAKVTELVTAAQNAAESTKQSRLAALTQMDAASSKLQEHQAALVLAQQHAENSKVTLEKMLVTESEAMDLLRKVEKDLAAENLKLAQAQTQLRQFEEAVGVAEANLRQANQRVADATTTVTKLKSPEEKSSSDSQKEADSSEEAAKTDLKLAEQQLAAAEAELIAMTQQRDSAVQLRETQKLQNEKITATHATVTRLHNELFQKHEQSRQVTVTQKQQLTQHEAAYRAAFQLVNMSQKGVVAANEALKVAESLEKEASAAVSAQAARQAEIEKRVTAVAQKVAPQSLAMSVLSPTVSLESIKMPFKLLQPTLPQDGIAVGGTLEIPIQVQRNEGFTGLITVHLFSKDPHSTFKADPLLLTESATNGTLQLQLPADFASAEAANFRLKATAVSDNQTRVVEKIFQLKILPAAAAQTSE